MTPAPENQTAAESRASQLIKEAQSAVALSGAGISTPSGIPDFRTAGSGLWTRFNPLEVASLSAFRYHPRRFYEWLRPLASHMLSAQPNPAHQALAELESSGYIQAVITQNIDTLHQRAGSQNVLEVHGTFESLTCSTCFSQLKTGEEVLKNFIEGGEIPRCPQCGEILKPDVVLFGEQLPAKIWQQARNISRGCDVMLVLGSSLTVFPVSDLPESALQYGAKLIIINQMETHLDQAAEVVIHGDLEEILPKIKERLIHGQAKNQGLTA